MFSDCQLLNRLESPLSVAYRQAIFNMYALLFSPVSFSVLRAVVVYVVHIDVNTIAGSREVSCFGDVYT